MLPSYNQALKGQDYVLLTFVSQHSAWHTAGVNMLLEVTENFRKKYYGQDLMMSNVVCTHRRSRDAVPMGSIAWPLLALTSLTHLSYRITALVINTDI